MNTKIFLIAALAIGLTACNNSSKTSTETKNTVSTTTDSIQILKVSRIENENQLPKEITYNGKMKESIRFIDKLGEHLVITTETGIFVNEKFKHENEGCDAELFAYHFDIKGNFYTQTWKVYDFISDCPVDIAAEFVPNTLQVTDLNQNGIAETWMVYKTVCHGDVSPCNMKVIMYEGSQKYAMRGEDKIVLSETEVYGGEYSFDNAFKNACDEFREFALNLWNNNVIGNLH